jgi:hypothetical protein
LLLEARFLLTIEIKLEADGAIDFRQSSFRKPYRSSSLFGKSFRLTNRYQSRASPARHDPVAMPLASLFKFESISLTLVTELSHSNFLPFSVEKLIRYCFNRI